MKLKGLEQDASGRIECSSQIFGRNSVDGNAVIGPPVMRDDGNWAMPVFIQTEDGPAYIRVNLHTEDHDEAIERRDFWLEDAKKGVFGLRMIYTTDTELETASACNDLWPCEMHEEWVRDVPITDDLLQ